VQPCPADSVVAETAPNGLAAVRRFKRDEVGVWLGVWWRGTESKRHHDLQNGSNIIDTICNFATLV
jgi:hypothetical protein